MKPLELPGLVTNGDAARWALLSPDGLFRYALGVYWGDPAKPILDIVMLNPSKADHLTDDTTFLKVCHFAGRDRYGGVLIRNRAALRATDPKELETAPDILGPRNLEVLAIDLPHRVCVGAWGKMSRIAQTRTLASAAIVGPRVTHCFGVTKDGAPLHPCRLAYATPIVTLEEARRAA